MAPFVVAAMIAAGLFTGGTVIRPTEPVVGSVLQGVGIGVAIGGGIGAAVGVPSALATGFGATTTGALVTGTALVGGGLAGAGTYLEVQRERDLEARYSLPPVKRVAHKHTHRKVASAN